VTGEPKRARMKVADLKPAPYNPRKITGKALEYLTESLRRFGLVQPIIVNERSGHVVGGHQRVKALEKLGTEETDVVVVNLDDTAERELNLALNNPGSSGKFDTPGLRSVMEDIRDADKDGMLSLGLELVAPMSMPVREAPTKDADDVESEEGCIYELGPHRLMCGSSLDDEQRAELTDRPIDVVVLDPPFEMPPKKWLGLLHDPSVVFGSGSQIRALPDKLYRFTRVLVKGEASQGAFGMSVRQTKVSPNHAWMVQCGTDDFCDVELSPDHELVAQCGTKCPAPKSSRRVFPSVVHRGTDLDGYDKPVEMLIEHLRYWTPKWKTVYDWFAGSGTTIIAAAEMKRVARCIELDQKKCDNILRRWWRWAVSNSVDPGPGALEDRR